MQITHVQYERRKSDGNYGNRCVSLSADLEPDDDVSLCIETLRAVALAQIQESEEAERRAEEKRRQEEMARYEEQRKARQAEIEAEREARGVVLSPTPGPVNEDDDHENDYREVGEDDDQQYGEES